MSLAQLNALPVDRWSELNSSSITVPAQNGKKFVYYVRLTDHAGNIGYLSTDGAVFDTQAPQIDGVTDGDVCYTTQHVTVTDENLQTVTINGQPVSTPLSLEGNKDTTYLIAAADKAGNSKTATVLMRPIASLAEAIKEIDTDNVTADDLADIDQVSAALNALNTTNAAAEELTEISSYRQKAAELKDIMEQTADQADYIAAQLQNYRIDSVTASDAASLAQLSEKTAALLGKNNLTAAQRAQLSADHNAISAMRAAIENAALEHDRIVAVVNAVDENTVTADDAQQLRDTIADIDNLISAGNLTGAQKFTLLGHKTFWNCSDFQHRKQHFRHLLLCFPGSYSELFLILQ